MQAQLYKANNEGARIVGWHAPRRVLDHLVKALSVDAIRKQVRCLEITDPVSFADLPDPHSALTGLKSIQLHLEKPGTDNITEIPAMLSRFLQGATNLTHL